MPSLLLALLIVAAIAGYIWWTKRNSRRGRYGQPIAPRRQQNRRQNRGQDRPNRKVEAKLMRMLNGDRATANRLIEREKYKNPGRSENWYWEKVLFDLQRDRRY